MQVYKYASIQVCKDTIIARTHKYRDKRIQGYKDTRILGYKDTRIQRYVDT